MSEICHWFGSQELRALNLFGFLLNQSVLNSPWNVHNLWYLEDEGLFDLKVCYGFFFFFLYLFLARYKYFSLGYILSYIKPKTAAVLASGVRMFVVNMSGYSQYVVAIL